MKVKCNRCGALMSNRKFNEGHQCEGKRPLSELPLDLLRALAYGKITEADAWKQAAERSK